MKKVLLAVVTVLIMFGCVKHNDNSFKVSVIFPLTGNTGAAMANNVKNALSMCVDSLNNAGGINGELIEIEFYDCRNADPKEGVAIANRLITIDKPDMVITMISGVVLNTSPIFESNNILNLAICSTANLFEKPKKYTLRTHISSNQTGYAIANAIVQNFNKDTVKILYANTEFGQASLNSFKKYADSIGITYLTTSFEEREMSYRNYILKSNLQSNDLLYAIGIQESLGKLIRECRQYGFNGPIIGGPDINSFLALDNMGENKDNIYYTKTSRGEEFNELNQRFFFKYKEPLDEIAILCCNGFLTVMACIKNNETNDIDTLMKNIQKFEYNTIMGKTSFQNGDMIFGCEIEEL